MKYRPYAQHNCQNNASFNEQGTFIKNYTTSYRLLNAIKKNNFSNKLYQMIEEENYKNAKLSTANFIKSLYVLQCLHFNFIS